MKTSQPRAVFLSGAPQWDSFSPCNHHLVQSVLKHSISGLKPQTLFILSSKKTPWREGL